MTEDIELYEAFFQKSKSYYTDKWTRFKTGQKFTFNVFAFLFGLLWFMYRKMYLEAALVFVVIIGEGFLEALILSNDIAKLFNIIATIAMGTITGFIGNYFYIRKADKIVHTAKTKFLDEEQLKMFLGKKGGVSYLFLIIIAGIIVFVFVYNNYMTTNGS